MVDALLLEIFNPIFDGIIVESGGWDFVRSERVR
jgi:hypothetical protein